jgi:hypothetical protein
MQINHHDFIDTTGKEPTEWDNKCFGGGMFVKRKGASKPADVSDGSFCHCSR